MNILPNDTGESNSILISICKSSPFLQFSSNPVGEKSKQETCWVLAGINLTEWHDF